MKSQKQSASTIAALTILPVKDIFNDRSKHLRFMSDGSMQVGKENYKPSSISNMQPHLHKPTIVVVFSNRSGGSWVIVKIKPSARVHFVGARLLNIRDWHTATGQETFINWNDESVASLYEEFKRSPNCRKGL